MTVWHLREQAAAGEKALFFFFSRLGSGASLLGDTQYAFQVLYLKSANEVNRGYASVLT